MNAVIGQKNSSTSSYKKKAGAECAEMMTLQTLPHDPMYQCVNKPESYYFHLGGIK